MHVGLAAECGKVGQMFSEELQSPEEGSTKESLLLSLSRKN